MQKVILYTRYKDELHEVGVTQMPIWVPGKEAKAVCWGTRFFIWDKKEKKYIEEFCYWAPSILDEK